MEKLRSSVSPVSAKIKIKGCHEGSTEWLDPEFASMKFGLEPPMDTYPLNGCDKLHLCLLLFIYICSNSRSNDSMVKIYIKERKPMMVS